MPDYDAFTYDVVDRFDVAWQQGFRHFLEVPTNRAGKRIVTTTHTTPDGFQLGKWQNRQRQLWKSGKLEAKREKALLLAGMVWDTKEALWEEGLEEFAALEPDAKGHRAATQKFVTPEGFKLGAWIHTQRTNYAKVPPPPPPIPPPLTPTLTPAPTPPSKMYSSLSLSNPFFPTRHKPPFSLSIPPTPSVDPVAKEHQRSESAKPQIPPLPFFCV